MKISVNRERLIATLQDLGAVGLDGSGGRTRLALDDGDKAGRDLFVRWLRDLELDVKIDAIGNIFGVLPGFEPGDPVTMGSHIDTVRNGGMFDGAVGVLGGLEVLRTIREKEISHRRSLAVAVFTNEEGARFAPDMMGSLVLTGVMDPNDAYRISDDCGRTVGEELDRIGYRGIDSVIPSTYLELHVEQGPFLDREGVSMGVVDGVQGIAWWKGCYRGQANHAGTTLMTMRNDALLAVSHLHVAVTDLVREWGGCATVGRVAVQPDIVNVIPGEALFTLDVRHPDVSCFHQLKIKVQEIMHRLAQRFDLQLELSQNVDVQPVTFDRRLKDLIQSVMVDHGLTFTHLWSGAGHDAQILARRVPSAMIFVPSIGGKSHCPQEESDFDQIADGVNVLLECALRVARGEGEL
ncbi:MAG: Zn-dependent hydrolase [Dethiosulfovibrio peptidovorans]|nr:MAG: Zn-dependent hydrolase [Dethiosulfovibrio peptidovorans]